VPDDVMRSWIPACSVPERCEDSVHVLLWQVRGSAQVRVEDEVEELAAGRALWIPIRHRHTFTVRENSVTVPVLFDAPDVETVLDAPVTVEVDRDLHALMLAYTVSETTIVRPPADLARQIIALLEARPGPSTALALPASGPAREIAEALLRDPGDGRSAEQLAASVHASVRTVERAFLAETGMTLGSWRSRRRMEAALVLLRADTVIDAVAHRVGYTSVNAFRRAFSRQMGITPTQYAQRFAARST
jgi:AraC-like DNA-binding protein